MKKGKRVTWEDVLEVAEEQFPKGKCKERGNMLVVLAYAKMALYEIEILTTEKK